MREFRSNKSDEEIWFWYKHIEAARQSKLMLSKYINLHGLNLREFMYMKTRIFYTKYCNPKEYAKLLPIGTACIASGLSKPAFIKKNNLEIHKSTLIAITAHIHHMAIIDRMKSRIADGLIEAPESPSEPEFEEPMKFIMIPAASIQQVAYKSEEPCKLEDTEMLQKQNEVEITIAMGVKVVVSPNIDSMKIIKIINLLKDL